MSVDHFPSTHATWIDAQLTIAEEGERAAAAGDAGGHARHARLCAHRLCAAAALAQADLGIAMGTGTGVAIEASDLTLVSGDLRAASTAVRLSRRTLSIIKGNLFWAFAYNVAAIPMAMLRR